MMCEFDDDAGKIFGELTVGEKLSNMLFLEALAKRYESEIAVLEVKIARSGSGNGCAEKNRRRRDRLADLRHRCLPFVRDQISYLDRLDFFAANRL